VLLSLWISRYSHFLKFGIRESTAPTEHLKLYSFGKGTVFSSCQTNTTFMLLYWSDNYWRQQFNKYSGMTLLKVRSLRQFEVVQFV
jgi:formate hydrogenlyase subunit 4